MAQYTLEEQIAQVSEAAAVVARTRAEKPSPRLVPRMDRLAERFGRLEEKFLDLEAGLALLVDLNEVQKLQTQKDSLRDARDALASRLDVTRGEMDGAVTSAQAALREVDRLTAELAETRQDAQQRLELLRGGLIRLEDAISAWRSRPWWRRMPWDRLEVEQ